MDNDCMFVRPADVFASHPDSEPKILLDTTSNLGSWDMTDERFRTYYSSPESTSSYNDESLPSPVDEKNSIGEEIVPDLAGQGPHVYQNQLPSHVNLATSPDEWQESLLATFVYDYSASAYGFCPSLQPHPMANIVSMIAVQNPACLHLILVRAAEYRLMCKQYSTAEEEMELQIAVMNHKDEALQIIRRLSSQSPAEGLAEELIPPIGSLAMLARSMGDSESELMHTRAVRQLFKSIGGPLQLRSAWLSIGLGHWESCYGSSAQSVVWDRSDFAYLHADMNQFFQQLWWATQKGKVSNRRSQSLDARGSPTAPNGGRLQQCVALQPDSELYRCLTRRPQDVSAPTQQDRSEMLFQLTSFLLLSTIYLDYHTDPVALQSYISNIDKTVAGYGLENFSCNNVMWLIQVHEHSDMQLKRIWAAAGWLWILRHVNYNVQGMVKDWLISILIGKYVPRALKLDSFAFSYAS